MQFDKAFQAWLYEAVQQIEKKSAVEMMVVIAPHSGQYPEAALRGGLVVALLTFTFLLFVEHLYFGDFLLFLLTLTSFLMGYLLVHNELRLKSFFTTRKNKRIQAELRARATFQKVGIHHTRAETGVLVYISIFEKSVHILPDRYVQSVIPQSIWQKMQEELNQVFTSKNPRQLILTALDNVKGDFAYYLPIQSDDVNELPETIDNNLFE
ncbi:MAG: TPM domain-containing protein [Bacteroidia bacterium]